VGARIAAPPRRITGSTASGVYPRRDDRLPVRIGFNREASFAVFLKLDRRVHRTAAWMRAAVAQLEQLASRGVRPRSALAAGHQPLDLPAALLLLLLLLLPPPPPPPPPPPL
jgi:hypothetical protein